MRSRLFILFSALSAVLAGFGATRVAAQEAGYPVCEMSDSALTVADDLYDILHLFGTDTQTYPHEFPLSSAFPSKKLVLLK